MVKWGEPNSRFYDLLALGRTDDREANVWAFHLYIDAFEELSSCRVNTLSLGPIPFTAIVEYSKIFDVGDFEEFLYLIRRMDHRYLILMAEKSKAKSKEKSTPTTKGGKKGR